MTKKLNPQIRKLLRLIQKEKPQKADAIIWLQGDRYDRGEKVLNLFLEGWAKKIVISGNNRLVGLKKRLGENHITLIEMTDWLKEKGVKSKQIIIDNRSFNTRDQAENVLQLGKKKGWEKIILVASLYHQLRAFLTFLKRKNEIKWSGRLINQPTQSNWLRKPDGRNKKKLDLFFEEIKKIKNYKSHVASFKEGFAYFKKENL